MLRLKKYVKVIFCLLLLTALVWGTFLLVGNMSIDILPVAKAENQLRILSMNVATGNILPEQLQENIIQTKPDIIVIIEWTGDNLDLDKFRRAGYQAILNHPRKKVHGLCILSKWEGEVSVIESPIETPCTLPLGQYRFTWQNQNITLFAMHAPPPVPACKGTTSDYLKAVANWIEHGKLVQDIGVGKQEDLVLIAGDFNCLSFDSGIQQLKSKHLADPYAAFNFTAQTWKPFAAFPYIAKIDYILFADTFRYINRYRFTIDKSDHLGLITDLTLSE